MDKNNQPGGLGQIGALLKSMGISDESTKEFITVCESWHNSEKSKLNKEYQAKLEKAKKVCVEEVEAHKASLSRGLQMYLESRVEQIGKAADKQAAIAESEAVMTLKKVNNLLSGLNIDSAANAQVMQAESKNNAKLKAEIVTLRESLETEKSKGAKMADIAEKSIKRMKSLETEVSHSKKLLGEAKEAIQKHKKIVISEHKTPSAKPKTKSSVGKDAAVISESATVGEPSLRDIDAIAANM